MSPAREQDGTLDSAADSIQRAPTDDVRAGDSATHLGTTGVGGEIGGVYALDSAYFFDAANLLLSACAEEKSHDILSAFDEFVNQENTVPGGITGPINVFFMFTDVDFSEQDANNAIELLKVSDSIPLTHYC